jgi:hypothetical protein
MLQLCHSNDFGLLWLCSQSAIRILTVLFAYLLVNDDTFHTPVSCCDFIRVINGAAKEI